MSQCLQAHSELRSPAAFPKLLTPQCLPLRAGGQPWLFAHSCREPEYAMLLPSPSTVQLPAHLLPASDVNVPAAPQEPVGILQEGQVPFPGISLLALSLSPLANHGGTLRSPISLSENQRVQSSYRPMIYLSAGLD